VLEILQEIRESKRRKNSSSRSKGTNENSESKRSSSVQLNITEFYRSTKVQIQVKPGEDQGAGALEEKRKVSSPNLSKSVRRRLLFD
jgi:flap endonuclease GEN